MVGRGVQISCVRTQRRRLFDACLAILGYSHREAAERVGCTYNHLILVLDGERIPSTRLEAAITALMRDAKPLLLRGLGGV